MVVYSILSTRQLPGPANRITQESERRNSNSRLSTRCLSSATKAKPQLIPWYSWDPKSCKYKTEQSLPTEDANEFDEYIFVVRTRIGKSSRSGTTATNLDCADGNKAFDLTIYVDIKSVDLRDVLRKIFRKVGVVCLREEKPTV